MIARPMDIFHFHNLALTVVEAEQVRYVRLRPIVELLGLDWRSARKTATSEDNGELYGVQRLDVLPLDTFFDTPVEVKNSPTSPPKDQGNASFQEAYAPQNTVIGGSQEANSGYGYPENTASEGSQEANLEYKYPENSLLTKQLCIRLDRVHMFLARVNTSILRAKGREDAANWLLTMQKEWASALYAYETHGIAIKGGQHKSLKDLFAMRKHASEKEHERLTYLITLALDAMGCPQASEEPSPQIEMFGGEA